MAGEDDHHLLTVREGETEETALKRWWNHNGLNHEEARIKRKITYDEQQNEQYLNYLKAVAVKMQNWDKTK